MKGNNYTWGRMIGRTYLYREKVWNRRMGMYKHKSIPAPKVPKLQHLGKKRFFLAYSPEFLYNLFNE